MTTDKALKNHTASPSKDSRPLPEKSLFSKHNYQLIVLGVLISFVAYLLMMGGKSKDLSVFTESEIYSFTRITLAPILIVLGFGIVFYGLLKREK